MGGVGQLFCTHRQAKTTDLETERERDRLREEERGRENDENGKLAK